MEYKIKVIIPQDEIVSIVKHELYTDDMMLKVRFIEWVHKHYEFEQYEIKMLKENYCSITITIKGDLK